jgi:hypothetical protein
MIWAWGNLPEKIDSFWMTLNYESSSLQTFQCPDESELENGSASFNAKRYSSKRVASYDCLCATGNTRVVGQTLRQTLLKNVDQSQVLFHPVKVQTRDRDILDFSVVIVKNCLPCLNPDKSNVRSWVVNREFTIDYDGLTFEDGCLGSLDIAADTMTGHIVVSDRLKEVLSKRVFKGLYFAHGPELQM